MRRNVICFYYGPLNGGGAERVLLDILRNFDYTQNEYTYVSFAVVEHL